MEPTIIDAIQNFGFPVACVIALGIWTKTYMSRIMDESREREQNYQEMLRLYGDKMGEISASLVEIKNDLQDFKS